MTTTNMTSNSPTNMTLNSPESMTLNSPETQALYYPINNNEWVRLVRELRPSQIAILMYLRTLAPFQGQTLSIGIREIAAVLGFNPSTVSRGLKILGRKSFINLELVKVHIQIKMRSLSEALGGQPNSSATKKTTDEAAQTGDSLFSDEAQIDDSLFSDERYFAPDNTVASRQQCCLQESSVAYRNPLLPGSNDRPLEPVQGTDSRAPYINHINQIDRSDHDDFFGAENNDAQNPTDEELLEFVKAANPKARKPTAYAVTCLKKSRMYWQERFKSHRDGAPKQTPVPVTPPPQFFEFESSCRMAMLMGDRPFVLDKLQEAWLHGWRDLVEGLCQMNQTWGFRVTRDGVE